MKPEDLEKLPWREVESSNVRRVAYADGVMHVEFLGDVQRVYRYADVPEEQYVRLVEADSVGRHFANEVRGHYDSERVEIETLEPEPW